MLNFRRVFPALVYLASLPALAQYSINKITISGGAPYTDAEVLSVAGLQPGQKLNQNSLANADQHLVDTGLFDDAQISLAGSGAARTVLIELKPKPAAALLAASFTNFVWFTPEELNTTLRARLPLYRGYCSDAGLFCDSIESRLQELLTAKGITATLSHTIAEPTTEHPLRLGEFSINEPRVRIASVAIDGAPAALAPALHLIETRAAGSPYKEGLGATTADFLLSPARNAGYITAKLENIQRTPSTSTHGIAVAYTAHLNAGEPYKVASITWIPTPLYSSADFTHGDALHPGDLATAEGVFKTERAILTAYRAKGYLDAYLDPSPTLDTMAHTVAYAFHAIQGEQYRLKSVNVAGLPPEAREDFNRGWKLRNGDIYNEHYVQTFLAENPAIQSLAGYTAGFQASADPQTHEVELTINFVHYAH